MGAAGQTPCLWHASEARTLAELVFSVLWSTQRQAGGRA